MASRPCEFFARTGKCRFGDKCRFSHNIARQSPGASSSFAQGGQSRSSASRASTPGTGRTANGPASSISSSNNVNASDPLPPLPKNACRNFWAQNKCRFGSNCTYKHIYHKNPSVIVSTPANTTLKPLFEDASKSTNEADGSPGGTSDGVAAGSGADAYVAMTSGDAIGPVDGLQSLRRYLKDDYRFDKALFVYTMMKVLSSATSGNKQWVRASALDSKAIALTSI
jgi:hypothetical protein